MGVGMSQATYLGGRFLLAMPGMQDPNFERSVTALFQHTAEGAFGVGVGHLRSGVSFHEVLEELDLEPGSAPDVPVHHGGPVEPGRGFVLHSPDWSDASTMAAGALGCVSSTLDLMRAITEGRGPEHWLFALGYAGWGAGQLESEMRHHGWYVADGRQDILFGLPAEERWNAVWEAEGIDPAMLTSQTGNA